MTIGRKRAEFAIPCPHDIKVFPIHGPPWYRDNKDSLSLPNIVIV